MRRVDIFSISGDGVSVVGTMKTHFYPQIFYLGMLRHDRRFHPYQNHQTETPMDSYCIRSYSVGDSGGSLIGVAAGDVKGGVGPRTTQISTQ